jgi:glycosyltransferase involved in cell wall biosynthesis
LSTFEDDREGSTAAPDPKGWPVPIRVAYGIDALKPGAGTENQLRELIRRLDRRDVRPYLCTLRADDDKPPLEDCPTLRLDVRRLISASAWAEGRRLHRFLRQERIDVVHTFFQDATIFCGLHAWLARVPVRLAAFRDLGFWRTPRVEFLMRRTYPLMTGFVANSAAVRDHFVDRDHLRPESFTVIPNGLDVAAIPFCDHAGPATDVGIVGNMNREVKRTDLFVEAAGLLAREFPAVRWHVIGDGHLRAGLEARARQLGLGERMVFTGRIADVPGYLARLQIGVLCSDSEGFSNAVLEYMLAGAAVVATDVGGNAEAITTQRTGVLVPPGDAGALAAGLRELLADPDRRQRIAHQARQHAAEQYGWQRCIERHRDLYRHGLTAAGVSTTERAGCSTT